MDFIRLIVINAEVVPCIKDKEGDRDDPSNSRPISLLPIISKVCKRAAHSQLVQFLQDHSIIHPLQSGNRKFHSTETALLHFTDEILMSMDEKHIPVVVLLASHAVVFRGLILLPPHKRLLNRAPHSFPIVFLPNNPSQSQLRYCLTMSNQMAGSKGHFCLP